MPGEVLVAIMAAGASRRLGQTKQLVEIDGQTLLARCGCIALEADVGPVMAVVGCNAVACAAALVGLAIKVVTNEQWEEGLAASIRCAVRSAIDRNAGALLLCPFCQPHLYFDAPVCEAVMGAPAAGSAWSSAFHSSGRN